MVSKLTCVCVCVLSIFSLDFLEEQLKIEAHDSEVLCLAFSPTSTGESSSSADLLGSSALSWSVEEAPDGPSDSFRCEAPGLGQQR